jgi:hypothetical protein
MAVRSAWKRAEISERRCSGETMRWDGREVMGADGGNIVFVLPINLIP